MDLVNYGFDRKHSLIIFYYSSCLVYFNSVYHDFLCTFFCCRVFMESKGKSVGVIEKVEVGMVCLARFSLDELYYRAKNTDIYPSGNSSFYACLTKKYTLT